MKTNLLKAIALATCKPVPEIVTATVFVRNSDGMEYSSGGSAPWPSHVETRGVCYYDARSNSTYGARLADAATARRAWHVRQLRHAVVFLRELRGMSAARVAEQSTFWLAR